MLHADRDLLSVETLESLLKATGDNFLCLALQAEGHDQIDFIVHEIDKLHPSRRKPRDD
jgi:hypothetical protein